MAPSNEKEANSAGEQNAEGEDGAVGGARSQVTGSGALLRVPRGLVRPSRQKPSILRAACRPVLSTCTGRRTRRMAGTDGQDRCYNAAVCINVRAYRSKVVGGATLARRVD